MSFAYGWAWLVLIPVVVVLIIVMPKNKRKGVRVANMGAVRRSEAYQKAMMKYRVGVVTILGLLLVGVVATVGLMARPGSDGATDGSIYNRDIVFCTDISYSIFELNLDVIDALKKTVAGLKGDRFGISMFNSSSVTVSPLTEDYSYVGKRLDKMAESIRCNEDGVYCSSYVTSEFINNGTIYEAEERGGSLIGDGLVGCAQLFNSNEDEERTKIIIFSTDNELGRREGVLSSEPAQPLYTTTEAMEYVRKKGIIVYGIGTANIASQDEMVMKNGVEKTGGKYFASANMRVSDIIKTIDSNSKSLWKQQVENRWSDRPGVWMAILVVVVLIMLVVMGVMRI